MTSLAFMFVEVPAPPWMTSTTNWSLSLPSRISLQASTMAAALPGVEQSELVVGAGGGLLHGGQRRDQVQLEDSGWPVMGKFSTARRVWTPQ